MTYKKPPQLVLDFIKDFSNKYDFNIQIKSKSDPDILLKIATLIVGIFNKRFKAGHYVTTILGTIWVPTEFFNRLPRYALEVIGHEIAHEYDRKQLGTLFFGFLYFFPQILAPLALLAIMGGGWLWCLLFLLCLAPIPSYGRMWLEMRGYRVNMMFEKYVYGSSDRQRKSLAEEMTSYQFTGPGYYFMWPFKKYVVEKLLADQEYENEQIYVEIRAWLKTKNLLIIK